MHSETSVIKGLAAGFAGGLVASWVMNIFQAELGKLLGGEEKSHGAQSQQSGSPEHGAGEYLQKRGADSSNDNAAERTANVLSVALADRSLSKKEKHTGGTIFHYAFGGATGAAYGAAAELMPGVTSGLGLPFGTIVWLAADEAVVPALGLSKRPREYPWSTHGYALASHLVYGMTTDLMLKLLRPRAVPQAIKKKDVE